MKIFRALFFACLSMLLTTACSHIPYRDGALQSGRCSSEDFSTSSATIDSSEEVDNDPCPVQRHVNGETSYILSFVEFKDGASEPDEIQESKLGELIDKIKAGGKNIILITFVHGWHHDASFDDDNVRSFKTALSYIDNFRQQRPDYANYEVVGLYVAWDGSAGVHCLACNIIGPPSVWSREHESDRIAAPIALFLKRASAKVKGLVPGSIDYQSNKMLVVGHSFGGNIVLTGFQTDYLKAVEMLPPSYSVSDDRVPMISPVGDLVVLLNPASPAEKWTKIQRAVRDRQGLTDLDRISVSDVEGTYGATLFSAEQRPILISYTSACLNRSDVNYEKNYRNYSGCDEATNLLYPISEMLTSDERRTTVGHLIPRIDGPRVGATHEFDINTGLSGESDAEATARLVKTSYADAARIVPGTCLSGAGWLKRAYAFGIQSDHDKIKEIYPNI